VLDAPAEQPAEAAAETLEEAPVSENELFDRIKQEFDAHEVKEPR
jgi:hypothetical protein